MNKKDVFEEAVGFFNEESERKIKELFKGIKELDLETLEFLKTVIDHTIEEKKLMSILAKLERKHKEKECEQKQ